MSRDLANQKFGRLTAKEIAGKDKMGILWRCQCECGGEKTVAATYLLNGHTKSCGCINSERKEKQDITGPRWGNLVAVKHVGYRQSKRGNKKSVWLWQCDCGNTKEIAVADVKHCGTRSCGCKAKKHISNLRKADISGNVYGRLTAKCPTNQRDRYGSILWELTCACGNTVFKTVNELKSGRVLSCGCYYKESRKEVAKFRRDFVENTSVSDLVSNKKPNAKNKSGYTGVWFNQKTELYEAYINYQKKRYYLGGFKNIKDAAQARRQAEIRLHDPIILEYYSSLTPEKQKEFDEYIKSSKKNKSDK